MALCVTDSSVATSDSLIGGDPLIGVKGHEGVKEQQGPMLAALSLLEEVCFATSAMLVEMTKKGG